MLSEILQFKRLYQDNICVGFPCQLFRMLAHTGYGDHRCLRSFLLYDRNDPDTADIGHDHVCDNQIETFAIGFNDFHTLQAVWSRHDFIPLSAQKVQEAGQNFLVVIDQQYSDIFFSLT